MTNTILLDTFKRAFFEAPSRTFGETYVQEILYRILGDTKYSGNDFDALRGNLKGEYKAVRVVYNKSKRAKTIYEDVMNSVSIGNRMASLSDIMTGQAVGNCQNIKLDNGTFDFDYLVYVLVDNDGFHLFEISGTDMTEFVKNNKFPNWCDSHGSKEKGRNGQFPITRDNIQWHMNTNYIKSISWINIMEISKNIALAPNKKS